MFNKARHDAKPPNRKNQIDLNMACLHKFHNELYLEGLDYEPTTLIVGTFNPIWPEENTAGWFYGRTHDQNGNQNNNFWEVLPRLYGEASLINDTPIEWKSFCKRNLIAITDLIYCIEDAEEDNPDHVNHLRSYSDKNIATKFEQHICVKLGQLIENYPSIKNMYLTRGTADPFWNHLWLPAIQIGIDHGIQEKKLLTPSGYAYYQQVAYNRANPNNQLNLPDFILMRWEQVWHPI